MEVSIWFQRSSQPIRFDNVYATYQKGDLFCVGHKDKLGQRVKKYPIATLYCVEETEFTSSQPKEAKDVEG